MRKIAFAMFLLMMGALNRTITKAQEAFPAFDTIKIVEEDYNQFNFTLQDTLIETLYIHTYKAAQLSDVHFKIGSSILGNILTGTTGFGISGAKETDYYLASTLQIKRPNQDWKFDVYCPGYVEKKRERVKNSDGSYSVETTYSDVFSWQNGALGYIIEEKDTIGWSYVYMEPRTDTVLQKWSQLAYKGMPQPSTNNYKEFAMKGEFSGIETAILYNKEDDRIYLIRRDTILGIYQCQKPPKMAIKKKNRIVYQPYLLVNKRLTEWERVDIVRLEMVGLRMRRLITIGY